MTRPGQGRTRLLIDWTRCDGHGMCAPLLPRRVELDEWGFPVIDPGALSPEEVKAARLAVQSCPQLALRLEREA